MKSTSFKLLTVAIAVAASAFTTVKATLTREEMNKQAIQSWYFKSGHSLNDAMSDVNWSTAPEEPCNDIVEVPCEIQFDADLYQLPATNTPLQNYLNSKGNATQVRTDAVSRRAE